MTDVCTSSKSGVQNSMRIQIGLGNLLLFFLFIAVIICFLTYHTTQTEEIKFSVPVHAHSFDRTFVYEVTQVVDKTIIGYPFRILNRTIHNDKEFDNPFEKGEVLKLDEEIFTGPISWLGILANSLVAFLIILSIFLVKKSLSKE